MNLQNIRIWIVGASSGIGLAAARLALQGGARVAATARRGEALAAINPGAAAEGRLLALPCNVCDAAAARATAAKIEAEWGGLDWALLCAGDCEYMDAQNMDDALLRRLFEVNFFAAAVCAQSAIPLLSRAAGGRGVLAAVSSASVFCALPRAAAYGASKAALSYFMRAVEAHTPNIDVCVAHPGFVRTPLTDRNDFAMPWLMSAEDAAAKILRGMASRRGEINFPRRLVFLLRAISALPRALRRRLWAKMLAGRSP